METDMLVLSGRQRAICTRPQPQAEQELATAIKLRNRYGVRLAAYHLRRKGWSMQAARYWLLLANR